MLRVYDLRLFTIPNRFIQEVKVLSADIWETSWKMVESRKKTQELKKESSQQRRVANKQREKMVNQTKPHNRKSTLPKLILQKMDTPGTQGPVF